jgi:hypothetical protein
MFFKEFVLLGFSYSLGGSLGTNFEDSPYSIYCTGIEIEKLFRTVLKVSLLSKKTEISFFFNF